MMLTDAQAFQRAAADLREGQLAMHGGEFDKYRMAMCLAAGVLEAIVALEAAAAPAPIPTDPQPIEQIPCRRW